MLSLTSVVIMESLVMIFIIAVDGINGRSEEMLKAVSLKTYIPAMGFIRNSVMVMGLISLGRLLAYLSIAINLLSGGLKQ